MREDVTNIAVIRSWRSAMWGIKMLNHQCGGPDGVCHDQAYAQGAKERRQCV